VQPTSVEYQLGFQAGLQYATTPRAPQPLSAERKFLALVTAVIGVGSAAAVVASVTNSRWRYTFAAFGISGLLLSTLITTGRVLNSGPAPWELR
jgi:hypothetical protein